MTVEIPQTIGEAARMIRMREIRAAELAAACLGRLEDLQPKLNAFITVAAEQAMERAKRLDRELDAGNWRGPLHGIPIAYKDNVDVQGFPTTLGLGMRPPMASANATVAAALQQAGTVPVGKTNMNELAAGISGKNDIYGPTRNPHSPVHSSGGSSSGCAVAVATQQCLGAIGTDTGGSIRVPASWCGIVGLRPTYGSVGMGGVSPRSSSLDVVGPLACTVADLRLLWEQIVGSPPHQECRPVAVRPSLEGRRLGLIARYIDDQVDGEVLTAVRSATDALTSSGAQTVTLRVPALTETAWTETFYRLLRYEFLEQVRTLFLDETEWRNVGETATEDLRQAASLTHDDYARALEEQSKLTVEVKKIFSQVDFILTPTMPTVAPALWEKTDAYERGRRFTVPFSLAGVPSISLPCGLSSNGLPIGLQIIAAPRRETALLELAAEIETILSGRAGTSDTSRTGRVVPAPHSRASSVH